MSPTERPALVWPTIDRRAALVLFLFVEIAGYVAGAVGAWLGAPG